MPIVGLDFIDSNVTNYIYFNSILFFVHFGIYFIFILIQVVIIYQVDKSEVMIVQN